MHRYAHRQRAGRPSASPATGTDGWVMNLGWAYDAMVWLADRLVFRGGLASIHDQALRLAALGPGDRVLDVGCGTGRLAVQAKAIVGEAGHVVGIDPGPRQIARARRRAERHGGRVEFEIGVVERIPAPEESFDAVLCTLVFHHLPEETKRRALAEIARVLAPGGRLALADFYRPEADASARQRFGAGESGAQDLAPLVAAAGFTQIETGDLGLRRIRSMPGAGFVVARRAGVSSAASSEGDGGGTRLWTRRAE